MAISQRKAKAIYSKYHRHYKRYRVVRVRQRVKVEEQYFRMIEDERKAKSMPEYKDLLDEDAPEEDEEIVKDVWEDDGITAKPKAPEKPAPAASASKPTDTKKP